MNTPLLYIVVLPDPLIDPVKRCCVSDDCGVHVAACTLGHLAQEGLQLSSAFGQQFREETTSVIWHPSEVYLDHVGQDPRVYEDLSPVTARC